VTKPRLDRATAWDNVALVESMTCPKCQSEMQAQSRAGVTFAQCTKCDGIFLDRSDRFELIEQENDWHTQRAPGTAPLPRITPDMAAPPKPMPERPSRSFIDAMFG
jgi:Zn-finger nucleic acid-binding protein